MPTEIYEDRIAICRGCKHYLSLLGNCGICKCFMKIKARLAPMSCPKKYWNKLHLQIIYYGREHCKARSCFGIACKICTTCYPKRKKPIKTIKA